MKNKGLTKFEQWGRYLLEEQTVKMETPSFVWEQLSADFAALAFDETRPCPKILLCFHHFFHLISNSAVGTAQREHLRCSFQRDHGANVLTDQSLSVETYDDTTMASP